MGFLQREEKNKYLKIAWLTIGIFAACALVVKVLFFWSDVGATWKRVMGVLSPYLTGFFIAYMLNPIVLFVDRLVLEQKCHLKHPIIRRAIALIVTYVIALGLVTLVFVFVIPQMYESVVDLIVNKLPDWYLRTIDFLERFFDKYDFLPNGSQIKTTIEDKLKTYTDFDFITTTFSQIFPSVWSTSVSVVKWLWNLFVALVVSIYLLADKNIVGQVLRRALFATVNEEKARGFLKKLHKCNMIFGGFIWGKAFDSFLIGVITLIILTIFKFPYAFLISVMVGVTNMIPYVGPIVGAFPGGFIILVAEPHKIILYALLILAIQQFDGWILGPKILGDSTGLRPVLILFALSIGGAVGGVAGMFLGVPFIAVLQYLVGDWVTNRLEKKGLTDADIEPAPKKITMKDIFFK